MTQDKDIVNRLWRRMCSARGTVFLEFGALAPFAMSLILFAHDFTKVLYAEQQLEIAARAACDIEAHLGEDTARPHKVTKEMTRRYLVRELNLQKGDSSYIKGGIEQTPGVSAIADKVKKFLDGGGVGRGNALLKFLQKLLGAILKIATLGTYTYMTDIAPTDRMVRISVSARITRFFPLGTYDFGKTEKMRFPDKDTGFRSLIVQTQPVLTNEVWPWSRKPKHGERVRHYCVMPYFETCCRPPETFVRTMRGWFNFLPNKFWPKDE